MYTDEAPAEMVIEPRRFGGYTWAICQPDACWGEWCSGICDIKEQAFVEAKIALNKIHRKQGY